MSTRPVRTTGTPEAVLRCERCMTVLDEPITMPSGVPRTPCPNCGGLGRFSILEGETASSVPVAGQVRVVAKRTDGVTGKAKRAVESKNGPELHYSSGEWCFVQRTVDRRNNRYSERVIDVGTGTVIREVVDQPLIEHVERGSARPKNKTE